MNPLDSYLYSIMAGDPEVREIAKALEEIRKHETTLRASGLSVFVTPESRGCPNCGHTMNTPDDLLCEIGPELDGAA